MDYSKVKENLCRVCLNNYANINWNDVLHEFSGVCYRDCYYKYTQMEENDEDFYPTNLCEKCANGMRNAHGLFEQAIKSFIILQNTSNVKGFESLTIETCDNFVDSSFIETCKIEKSEINIDEVICYSPLQDDNIEETEEDFNLSEISTSQNKSIHNTSGGTTIEQPAVEKFDIKLLTSIVDKDQIKKRRYLEALNTALDVKLQLEISDKQILKALLNGNATKKPSQNLTLENNRTHVSTVTVDNIRHLKDEQTMRNFSNPISANKKSTEKSYSQKLNSKKSFEKNLLISKPANSPSSISNPDDGDISSCELSNPTCSFSESFEKSSVPKKKNCDIRLDPKEHDKEEEATNFPENNVDSNNEKKPFKPSEIALLKKIYGNDFDMESIKQKSKPKPANRSKGRPKICQYCSMVVFGKTKILLHEATHLPRERSVVCPKCGVKFFTKDSLNNHIKVHDENREKKHKCAYCEKSFYHSGARNVHQRIHLGLMVKCPICPKEFYRQVDLDKHLPSHSVSKLNNCAKRVKHKVLCQYCNKYIMTNTWKAHKAAHLKEPQVKCKICDKEFYARESCVKHLRKKHGETSGYQQYIHAYNKNRMTHLLIKQQEAGRMVIE